MNITTDDSMIYGLATAYETFDNLKFTPENATTILVEKELFIELAQSRQAIERVRELHEIYYNGTACSCCEGESECVHCGWNYPCPTIKALDGE